MGYHLLLITKNFGMKINKLLGIVVLGFLLSGNAYAVIVLGSDKLLIVTNPSGANCTLENNKGKWNVITPDTIKIKLSKKMLEVTCSKNRYKITKEYLSLTEKDSVLTKISNFESTSPDWIEDGIWDALTGSPFSTAFNVVVTAGEFITTKVAKGLTSLYQPSTYAMEYRIVKKNNKQKKIPLVKIELNK